MAQTAKTKKSAAKKITEKQNSLFQQMEEQNIGLEQAFSMLEETIEGLESEDITLEESFAAYEKGMEILRYCNQSIDRVEKKVLQINERGELCEFE